MQVPGVSNGEPLYTTLNIVKKMELKIRELSWEKLENGGSSYLISWSISRRTEIQVGTNRCDNDNHEFHDLDTELLDINPVKSD